MIFQRPSTLASACARVAVAAIEARPYAAGQPAVSAPLAERLVVPTRDVRRTAGASKINNSMSNTQLQGKGVATSVFQDQKVSGLRVHTVDQIQGGNARGIPPRGRPV
jgi:hypothetical protein